MILPIQNNMVYCQVIQLPHSNSLIEHYYYVNVHHATQYKKNIYFLLPLAHF